MLPLLLVLTLAWGALAFGGVYPWGYVPLCAAAVAIGASAMRRARHTLLEHFHVASLGGYGCDEFPAAISAAGGALSYARETQRSPLTHISSLSLRPSGQGLLLDAITLRNLEVKESIRQESKGATLLSSLDLTKTPMGHRALNRRLSRPITDIEEINKRLESIDFFINSTPLRLTVRKLLTRFSDIERIAARIAYGNAGPRDLIALAESLVSIPEMRQSFSDCYGIPEHISTALEDLHELPDTIGLIRSAIVDDPPAIARNGGLFRQGYSKELDSIRGVLYSGKDWIRVVRKWHGALTGVELCGCAPYSSNPSASADPCKFAPAI